MTVNHQPTEILSLDEVKRLIYTFEHVFNIHIYSLHYRVYSGHDSMVIQAPHCAKKPTVLHKTYSIKGMNRYGWTKAELYNHNILWVS